MRLRGCSARTGRSFHPSRSQKRKESGKWEGREGKRKKERKKEGVPAPRTSKGRWSGSVWRRWPCHWTIPGCHVVSVREKEGGGYSRKLLQLRHQSVAIYQLALRRLFPSLFLLFRLRSTIPWAQDLSSHLQRELPGCGHGGVQGRSHLRVRYFLRRGGRARG